MKNCICNEALTNELDPTNKEDSTFVPEDMERLKKLVGEIEWFTAHLSVVDECNTLCSASKVVLREAGISEKEHVPFEFSNME